MADDAEGIVYADPAGHYFRPDAVQLVVNRERRTVMTEVNMPEVPAFSTIALEEAE